MAELIRSSITPCLWFDGDALPAAEFYTSLFPNSQIDRVDRSPADYPNGKEGDVLTVTYTLDRTPFVGLNGGPEFTFDEAVSFIVDCLDQTEVDRYWDALTKDGGEPGQCGWLKDRYGLSWQIVPRQLNEMLQSEDGNAARRAMAAMLSMGKIDVAVLERAFEGDTSTAGTP
jgi:predicted 3-demethylubiquinone-9 3-methyltransferase (glyoxalase superfamily)